MTGFSSELVNLELKEADCPVVLLNCHRDNDLFDRIYGNDFRAGYQATQALIARGYRKVYHFSGNSASSVISSERERGYRQAMQDAGLPITHEMILTGDLRQEGGYQLAQICLNGQDPIAICCNNFLMCLGAMKYAQQPGHDHMERLWYGDLRTATVFLRKQRIHLCRPQPAGDWKVCGRSAVGANRSPRESLQSLGFIPVWTFMCPDAFPIFT